MKNPGIVCFIALFPAFLQNVFGQGFINLDFEDSYVVSSQPSGQGFNYGTANVPGWTAYDAWGAVNYSGGTTLIFNNETLDAANASLVGVAYRRPAIFDQYSVLLKGGTVSSQVYGTNGVGLGQTGQIPMTAKSINFWGTSYFRVSFGGHVLPLSLMGTSSEYYPGLALFAADISSYAGQTGELLFHTSWQSNGGMIDAIQFSASPIPGPGSLTLFGIGAFYIGLRMRRRH